jgi:YD repeat-containing protein
MVCPLCKAEVSIQQGFCPHCGSLIGPGFAPANQGSSRNFVLRLLVLFGVFLIAVAVAGVNLWRSGAFRRFAESINQPFPRPVHRYNPIKVNHGAVLRPEQLHGASKLYFVPMGPQIIPPEELAAHYKQKFDLDITVLPGIPIDSSMPHTSERRYFADGLMRSIMNAYPQLADDREATLIGLTNVDLYIHDEQFATAYHGQADSRVAVVSSRGFDYESNGAEAALKQRRDLQERRMLEMITKYIALMHWGFHENNDVESVLDQPLIPDGRRDDLYESDLDPESTAAGRWSDGCALIYFVYSYHAKKFTRVNDSIGRCGATRLPAAPGEEWIVVELTTGELIVREPEMRLASTPPIDFVRGYVTNFPQDEALGYSSDHTYDSILTSNDGADMRSVSFRRMDYDYDGHDMTRTDPGKGFLRTMAYEGKEPLDRVFYRAKMTWRTPDVYDAITIDHQLYSYLGCGPNQMCYFSGYRDAAGHELKFERDGHRKLLRLTPARGPGLTFTYNADAHVSEVRSGSGQIFHYDYDPADNLAQITRPDGVITKYGYDAHHNLTSIAVLRRAGAGPQTVLSAEYDLRSRLTRLQIADLPEYRMGYRAAGSLNKVTVVHDGFTTLISPDNCDCGEYHIFRRPLTGAKTAALAH